MDHPRKKARKIVCPVPLELQEARGEREKGKSNRILIDDTLWKLRRIQNVESKSHLKEATLSLFDVIHTAQRRLLEINGALGIITQDELRIFREESDAWLTLPFAERMAAYRAPSRDLLGPLNARFKAGWLVEPGRFLMFRDRTGVIVIVDSINDSARPRRAPRTPRAARASQADTPTPDQLQTWFDLPSEPPHAEGSPTAS
jgi:hypothetical protein